MDNVNLKDLINHLFFLPFYEIFYVKKITKMYKMPACGFLMIYKLFLMSRIYHAEKQQTRAPIVFWSYKISRNCNAKLPFEVQSESPRKSKLKECVTVVAADHIEILGPPKQNINKLWNANTLPMIYLFQQLPQLTRGKSYLAVSLLW